VARCKCRTPKSRQKSPSGHHPTTLSGYIDATKACIDHRKKNFLSSNISSTCPHNMVNFGPLAAEIVSLVWGTPGNFNGFRVLAALLHGTLVVAIELVLSCPPPRVHNPNGKSIASAVFAGLTSVTGRPTDRPHYWVSNSRPHVCR